MKICTLLLALGLSTSVLAAPPLLVEFGDPQPRTASATDGQPVSSVAIQPLTLHWYDASGQLLQTRRLFDPRIVRAPLQPGSDQPAPMLYRNQGQFLLTPPAGAASVVIDYPETAHQAAFSQRLDVPAR